MLTAAGTDETLPTLTGVQMTLTGLTLTLAATDRYGTVKRAALFHNRWQRSVRIFRRQLQSVQSAF
ncbi:hypothetical protein [Streptomyces microflavus]|uniref:hypothetical protein n=1 Tax=Streptomyces microflavus TaxID=1919 RepID=UPI003B2172E3